MNFVEAVLSAIEAMTDEQKGRLWTAISAQTQVPELIAQIGNVASQLEDIANT
jgi:hypothetical protein